ncbi:hypothetical protein RW64_16605 [Geobacter sulfurreducens]|nr:hypothetical protein RW64_16605 [Geobacter sulfurreducens]
MSWVTTILLPSVVTVPSKTLPVVVLTDGKVTAPGGVRDDMARNRGDGPASTRAGMEIMLAVSVSAVIFLIIVGPPDSAR